MASLTSPPAVGGPVGRLGRAVHTEGGHRVLHSAVWVLALASGLGFILQGANTPPRPHLTNQYLPGTAPLTGRGPGSG